MEWETSPALGLAKQRKAEIDLKIREAKLAKKEKIQAQRAADAATAVQAVTAEVNSTGEGSGEVMEEEAMNG